MSITANNISLSYKDKDILKNIDIDIKKGEIITILGPNGAGKSSLLNIISGEIDINKGEVYYEDSRLSELNIQERAYMRSVMSQSQPIVFDFSVREIVEMGWLDKGNLRYSDNMNLAISGVLNDCDIQHLENRKFNTLSGGEQRRVHFARSLIQLWRASDNKDSRYLLLDEPTANLDLFHQINLMKMLKELSKDGVGILVILHDLNLAFKYSDKIAMIKNGSIIAYNEPKKIIDQNILSEVYDLTFDIQVKDSKININYV
ncbi:MAG: heme ABC transporter ATP-binding protein [Cytophagia bacterium]|nr:heme ABC transporter ATP-binding protein [Cytophagia bacterium]|tara:strand:- start:2226 stop:3005 length:780 start_codon:yes stop_codon:yes gene_type:complete